MFCFTVAYALIAAAFWRQLFLMSEQYNILYSHITLSPLSRATLQHYMPTKKERLVAKTVADIYVGVTQAVSRNPKTTWNGGSVSIEQLVDHYRYTHYCYPQTAYADDIISKLKPLFPGCDVKVWRPNNELCVSWHNPVIYDAYIATNARKKALVLVPRQKAVEAVKTVKTVKTVQTNATATVFPYFD